VELTSAQLRACQKISHDKKYVLLFGGSRSGKTALVLYTMLTSALTYPNSRYLIIHLHLSNLKRSIITDTLPKIANLMSPSLGKYVKNKYNKNDNYIEFPNGSSIWFGGIDKAERSDKILGTEYLLIFLNEITQIDYEAYQTLVSRCALNVPGAINRIFLDCNPSGKSHWAYKLFIENKDPVDGLPKRNTERYVSILMNPADNPHLPDDYKNFLQDMSERQRRRFEAGEWLDDIEGALWKQENIDANRVPTINVENLSKITVAIDPSVTADPKKSDETGIVAAGVCDNIGYVIKDVSGVHTSSAWAKKAVELYHSLKADKIVCESNQGGDLVVQNIHMIDKSVRVKKIHAKRGKVLRADPVVNLYEQNRVKHVGHFNKLEDQMTSWTPESSYSPDRMDALVYAISDLMVQPKEASWMVI
jgi:phage terminase large subunit